MIKRVRKPIVAIYDDSKRKNTVNLGTKKRSSIIVIYDPKAKKLM